MNRYLKFVFLVIISMGAYGCKSSAKNIKITTTGDYPSFKDSVDVRVYNDTNGKINVTMKCGDSFIKKEDGFIDPRTYWEIESDGLKSFIISYNGGKSEIWFFEKNHAGIEKNLNPPAKRK